MSIKQTLGRVVKSTNMPDLTKSFSPEQLAEAITAKRTGMKLTLVDVSAVISLSKPTLIKIEKGNTKVKLATISIPEGSDTDISLTYESSWVEEGFAISPYLPLDGNFDHRAVRNYLQNLLPEGKGLEEITTNSTISKNNTFGLIKIIGEYNTGNTGNFNSPISTYLYASRLC